MSDEPRDDFSAFAAEAEARRRHRRWFVDFQTNLVIDGETVACSVYDVSPGGACVEPKPRQTLQFGDRIEFELPGFGAIPAEVRYAGQGYLGLMFLHDDEGEIEVARYLVAIEQNRQPPRHDLKVDAMLRASGIDVVCVVEDLSRLGARVLIDDARHIMEDQGVTLELPGIGAIAATVQRIDNNELGLAFLQQLAEEPHFEKS